MGRKHILTTVPYKKYKKGSDIELLYLPEYSRKVVIKGEEPTSITGFFVDSISLVILTALFVVALTNLWR